MDINHKSDQNRTPRAVSSEKIILYVDDLTTMIGQDMSSDLYHRSDDVHTQSIDTNVSQAAHCAAFLYPPSLDSLGFQLDDRSALYPLNCGEKSSCSNLVSSHTSAPRHSKHNLDVDQRSSSRRSSTQLNRSRANSCTRPTPLGDDRRASICKKTKSRKASVVQPRKNSIHSTKKSIKQTQKIIKDTQELEQTRRHRRIVMIILGIFIFLLTASVLVVVMTLTHSMFLSPASGSKELTEHRVQLRKENEELLNSLNRDISAPENITASP